MKPKQFKYKGESMSLGEWAKKLGIPYNNLYMRLQNGWTFARAVEEPVKTHSGRKKSKSKGRRGRKPKDAMPEAPAVGEKRRRGRPPKVRDGVLPSPTDATQGGTPPSEADVRQDVPKDGNPGQKGLVVPNKPRVMTKDFLRGMAEGIWLTISSVAMMMAEGGADAAGRNLQRVEEMFKGGFAEKFASAVSGKGK